MAPDLPPIDPLVAGLADGDRASLARAITLIESRRADHQAAARDLVQRILPMTGGARRVGITGAPGVGKSTLIEALGSMLTGRGHRVAVLAVDPSSRRTGGSILGDKTRMTRLAAEPNAFIRPSPSAGTLGGVAAKTRETMLLCEAAGFDVVIVETVGVGQSETAVADLVDFFLVLMQPGAGDELQGLKKGVLELADMIAVNKADVDGSGPARATAAEYRSALRHPFRRPIALDHSGRHRLRGDGRRPRRGLGERAASPHRDGTERRLRGAPPVPAGAVDAQHAGGAPDGAAARGRPHQGEARGPGGGGGRRSPRASSRGRADRRPAGERPMTNRPRLRVLVTGFGRFPGAPSNPTERLVRDLRVRRRPGLAHLQIAAETLPVTWEGSRQALAALRRELEPDAILMFGLAGSARAIRVETRAVNVANRLRADAAGRTAAKAALAGSGPPALRSRADARRVLAAIRATGAKAQLSQDAGTYLCNATLWSALAESGPRTPVLFIHVPPISTRVPKARVRRKRPTLAALTRAAAAALLALRLPPGLAASPQPSPPTQTYFTSR